MDKKRRFNDSSGNQVPATAHPVGTGIGVVSGAVAGATLGAAGGLVGIAMGATVGAVAGGLIGNGAAGIGSSFVDAYWRDRYQNEACYTKHRTYEDYAPALKVGFEGRARHRGKTFEQAEPDLQRTYRREQGNSKIAWAEARHPARTGWDQAGRSP